MIEGFKQSRIGIGAASWSVHTAGRGPAILLLHGYPQSHYIWRFIGPALASDFTVVAPDVRGYGASDAPAPASDSSNYSKRVLAAECVALMAKLGHTRFAVIGHDRGGRIAYRLALDHASHVSHLVTLDIIPTGANWEAGNPGFAIGSFHWGFLAQPAPFPERMIGHDSDFFLRHLVMKWTGIEARMTEDALAEYCTAFRRPEVIAASCADYRSGATIDNDLDRMDVAAGRKIACPMLAVLSNAWSDRKRVAADPLEIWQRYANTVQLMHAPCGHFIPEEAPEAVTEPIRAFLRGT
jgi:haloacetate dehalogenase